MVRYFTVLLATVLTIFGAGAAIGQDQTIGLVSSVQAGQLGLQRSWFTHVEVDRARGAVVHLTLHVSATDSYVVYEVVSDRGRQIFTEKDLDRFGVPLGKEAVKKVAQRTTDDLNLIHQNAKLTTRVVPFITLYAITDRGMLHAIDAETGRTLWVTAVGSSGHPSEAPAASDQYVAAVNGSMLTLIEQNTGKVVWQQSVEGAPGAGPVLSQRFVFVPMTNGTIEGYDLEQPRKTPWMYQSHGRAVIQPLYTGTNIAWPTDRGHFNVAHGNENGIRYRFESSKPIVCRPVELFPDRLVVASTDGYVYCLKEERGTLVWRFSSGEPITETPAAIGNRVYVITEDRNLYTLSGDDGLEQWRVPGMQRFVAASSDRLYCINELGRLTVLQAATGAILGSLPTENLDLVYENHQTDRILIGTRHGQIQCLHETRQEWPLIQMGVLPDAKAKAPAAPKKKKPVEAKPEKTESDNPFGDIPAAKPSAPAPAKADEGGDPFGGGGGEATPPAAAPAADTDPFAAPSEESPAAKPGSDAPAGGSAGDDPFGFRPAKVGASGRGAPAKKAQGPRNRKSTTPPSVPKRP